MTYQTRAVRSKVFFGIIFLLASFFIHSAALAESADGNSVVGIVTDEALSGVIEPYLATVSNDLVHVDGFE